MCGIAGILAGREERGLVQRMCEIQAHRGPDGSGLKVIKVGDGRQLTLGHRRLSILDLSNAGAQPMLDTSGKYSITYNGEIYNYLELRDELLRLGASFRSHSDTEVILEGYKVWGDAVLGRLNGMFAFALYDDVLKILLCARDRYGEKPLLYSATRSFFAFASEYKGILQNPEISMEIDEWRLIRAAHNAGNGLDADSKTVFDDVQQLLPGEALKVDALTLECRIWRYWQINPAEPVQLRDESEVFEEFRELLIDSVRLRLRSDVSVGSCLSGGLDSSAIVCIVRQLLGAEAPYNTFTGRFPGTSADEWQYAMQVIDATGVRSHVVIPTPEQFLLDLSSFVWLNELPVGSTSQFAQWCVFRLAKECGVTVLLDGQGADESLGGYEQYFGAYIQSLREIGDSARLSRELKQINERYPLALSPPLRTLRDRIPFRVRHWVSNRLGVGTSVLYGLRAEAAEEVARQNSLPRLPGFNALTSVLMQDTFGRYLTTLLRYGDRNSMAHSREVRLPFCDHRIAEFVASQPPQMIMGEVQTKRLLRESMKGILPEGIRSRWNKQGFRPPQPKWFAGAPMIEFARDMLSSSRFRGSNYWQAQWWEDAINRLEAGESALAWAVWAPLAIESWKEYFLQPLNAARSRTAATCA